MLITLYLLQDCRGGVLRKTARHSASSLYSSQMGVVEDAGDHWSHSPTARCHACISGKNNGETNFQHFEHACALYSYCGNTQIRIRCVRVTNETLVFRIYMLLSVIRLWNNGIDAYSERFRNFIDLSAHLFIYSNVLFPILLLFVLNVLLICALRKRSRGAMSMTEEGSRWSRYRSIS